MLYRFITTLFASIVLLGGTSGHAADPACEIRTASAVFDVCQDRLSTRFELAETLTRPARESGTGGIRVIKYGGPIAEASREMLRALDVEVLDYLPWYTYVIRAPRGLPEDPAIVWQGRPFPVWKVSPDLLDVEAADREASVPVELVLYRHADVATMQSRLMDNPGVDFITHSRTPRSHRLNARVDVETLESWIAATAALSDVRGLALRRPARLLNSQAGWLHQSGEAPGELPVFEQGIFGCGQLIGVLDSGFDYGSCAFRDNNNPAPEIADCSGGTSCPSEPIDDEHRKISLFYNWSGGSAGDSPCNVEPAFGHGTHVAGSISGNQVDNPADCSDLSSPGNLSNFDGTAPGARLITQQAGGSLEYLNNFGGNIYHAARTAYESGARIHNNSWGSGCCLFGLFCVCSEPLPYDGNAPLADEVTWEFPELLLAIAAGNDGQCCGEDSIGNPAIAKNALTVGATLRGASADGRAGFSSRGPTLDRRIKPDVMAQGDSIVSAGSSGSPGDPTCSECTLSGTSMASPTAAGLAALVRDYLAQGFYPSGLPNESDAVEQPHAALIRAMLINSSQSMSGSGAGGGAPNQRQGWGRITLDQTLYFDGDDRRLWLTENRDGLITDDADEFELNVEPGQPLHLTLVWHDYPGAGNSNPSLVNQLRLEVEAPDGEVWTQKLPTSGDPNPFWDATGSDRDDRNTVHHFVLSEPEPGSYPVRVRAINVAMGDAQPYALVASGGIASQAPEPIFSDGFEADAPG